MAILLDRSFAVSRETMVGDLLCLLAGGLYVGYLILLQRARANLGSWGLLMWSSIAGLPLTAVASHLASEPFWPQDWTPLIALAFTSQILGQGLLVYSLGYFRPLVIGLALLTQPAVASVVGWLAFDERLGALDLVGMALMATALVLARETGASTATGPADRSAA